MSKWDNADNRLILSSGIILVVYFCRWRPYECNDSEYRFIFVLCLMTNRLNPCLARAKLNVDSFIASGFTSSNHVNAFSGSSINFQMQKAVQQSCPLRSCDRGLIILLFRGRPLPEYSCGLSQPTASFAKPRNHHDSLLHQRLNEADVGEIAIHYYPQCPLPNYVPTAIRVAAVILLRVSVPVAA